MSAPTPAPPPGGGPAPQRRRPRRRALVIVLVSVLAVALACCGGAGFALYRYLDHSAETPTVAVDRFLRGVEADGAPSSDVLCRTRRDDAEPLAQKIFAKAQLARDQVSDLRWIAGQPKPYSDDKVRVLVDVSYVIEAVEGGRQVQQVEFQFSLVNEGGWKVCDIR